MTQVQISIVIPLYNKAPYIKRAIDSVFAQTFQDFELVVVNDGSTDGSEKIVETYKDSRLKLLNRFSPSGETAARNFGIRHASADLIAFLDADDRWNEKFLETVLRLSKKYPDAGAYATSFIEKHSSGRFKQPIFWFIPKDRNWEGLIPEYFRSCVYGCSPVWSSAVAIPKKVFNDIGGFAEGVTRGGDLDMWARISLKYDIAFSRYIGAVYYKNVQGSSIKKYKCLEGYKIVDSLKHALDNSNFSVYRTRYIKEYANKFILGSAAQCIKAGEIQLAKKHLRNCHTKRFFGRKIFLVLSVALYCQKKDYLSRDGRRI